MILILTLLSCMNSNKVKGLNVPSEEGVIALCPGQALPLQVNAKMKDGKRKSTTAVGRANLNWKHLEMSLDGRAMSGSVFMPQDPLVTWQKPLTLKVWLAERPDVVWEGQVVARYDCDYVVDLRGQPGQSELDTNEDGADGDDGASSSADRGESGQDGQDGRDGRDGGHGERGPQAQVYLVPSATAKGLLEARVELSGQQKNWIYLMTPGASSLLLDVSGGTGGAGGPGNHGGSGGSGGSGLQDGPGGAGGDGGNGGDGGDGGDGGSAELIVNTDSKPWADSITLRSQWGSTGAPGEGGYAGKGGNGDPQGNDGREGREGRQGRQGQMGEVLPVKVTTVTPSF